MRTSAQPIIEHHGPPRPPDLQALVKAYGGWPNIPAEAWSKHDAAMAAYQAWLRMGPEPVKRR